MKMDNGNDGDDDDDDNNDDGDHGNEVGDEDVVARVREICPQVCRTELGHQHLIIIWTMFIQVIVMISMILIMVFSMISL